MDFRHLSRKTVFLENQFVCYLCQKRRFSSSFNKLYLAYCQK